MSNQLSNPSQWATGSDAPTSKQKQFLETLASSKGATDLDPSSLNKSSASSKIDELKNKPDDATSSGGASSAGEEARAGGVGGAIQDPDGWATGDDPATGKQTGYIAVMAKEAGEQVDTRGMGKTEASKRIEELKGKTGM